MSRRIGLPLTAAVIWAVVLLFPLSPIHASWTVVDLEKRLMCVCGCSMVLASCLCSRADEMREDLRSKRSSGMDAEEAIRGYVLRYGQQVLSSPPKRGFNLAAWTGPLVAIIAGALILAGSLKNFVKRGRRRLETLKEGDEILPQLRTRVESELKKYM